MRLGTPTQLPVFPEENEIKNKNWKYHGLSNKHILQKRLWITAKFFVNGVWNEI